MNEYPDALESLWDNLLSRQPELIRQGIGSLSDELRQSVLEHLQRMVSEPGWQPEQRKSAQAALNVLTNVKD